jgi:hypothetical protein
MGLLNFFFKQPTKVIHHFFGEIKFNEFKRNPEKNYFECNKFFEPVNEIIDIGIEANKDGPMENQVAFFKNITTNYDEIKNSIIPLLEDEFGNWKEGFRIKDFKKEFKAVYIFIPKCNSVNVIWEIAFESTHDESHTFTITMNNFIATEVLIDG